MTLPQHVIEEDHRLEKSAESASEALAEYRYHWTLDPANPERVTLTEYAQAVGHSISTIHKYAHGYEFRARAKSLGDAMEQANMGAETRAATEAIAKKVGLSPRSVRDSHYPTIRGVREATREQAEQNQTSFEDELPAVVEQMVAEEDLKRDRAADRRKSATRSLNAEHAALGATLKLYEFLKHLRGISWNEEERELFIYDITRMRDLLNSAEGLLNGQPEPIDWDAELADILKGAKSG